MSEPHLANIGRALGVDPEAFVEQMASNLELARAFRNLLGVEAPSKKRAGRPPKDQWSWGVFVLVTRLHRKGATINGACKALAHKGVTAKTIRQTYYRARRVWRTEDIPEGLAALFSQPPSKVKR